MGAGVVNLHSHGFAASTLPLSHLANTTPQLLYRINVASLSLRANEYQNSTTEILHK